MTTPTVFHQTQSVLRVGLSGLESTGGFFIPVINLLSYVAAAGLGASFFALFKANRYVVTSTFDPNFEPTYWVRFALGLIAGTILGAFVDIGGGQFGKQTLAALGGFSADAVQRILNRLVEAVSSLVDAVTSVVRRGDVSEALAGQQRAAKTGFDHASAEHRLKLASELIVLQRELSTVDRAELEHKIQRLVDNLIEPGRESPPTTARSSADQE